MHNEQHRGDSRLNLNRAKRVKPLFPVLIYPVGQDKTMHIFKSQCRQFE